jgi:hypothetical protein
VPTVALERRTWAAHLTIVRRFLAFLALASALGCVRSVTPAPIGLGPPQTLTTSLIYDPDALWSLHRAHFAVDGAVSPWGTIGVAAGEHTIGVRVELLLDCDAILIRGAQGFVTNGASAAMEIEVVDRGDGEPLEQRFDLRWTAYGGATVGYRARPIEPDACRALDELHRAVCLVREGVREAKERRDVIALNCQHDKATKIAALLPAAEAGDAAATKAIVALAKESRDCVGEDIAYVPQTSVTVEDRCE